MQGWARKLWPLLLGVSTKTQDVSYWISQSITILWVGIEPLESACLKLSVRKEAQNIGIHTSVERMKFWSLDPLPLDIDLKSCNSERFINPSLPWLWSCACLWVPPRLGCSQPCWAAWDGLVCFLSEHSNSHSSALHSWLCWGLSQVSLKASLREKSIPNPPNYLLLQQQSAESSPICGCGSVPEVLFQQGIVAGWAVMLLCSLPAPQGQSCSPASAPFWAQAWIVSLTQGACSGDNLV